MSVYGHATQVYDEFRKKTADVSKTLHLRLKLINFWVKV